MEHARLRVMICRKHVGHESRKNFKLDFFTPDDGHFEYAAVATNLARDLPAFYAVICGRGAHEKTLAELKGQFALDVVPTRHYGANCTWQQLSVLAYSLIRSFQLDTLTAPIPRSRKRTYIYLIRRMRTPPVRATTRAPASASPAGRAKATAGYAARSSSVPGAPSWPAIATWRRSITEWLAGGATRKRSRSLIPSWLPRGTSCGMECGTTISATTTSTVWTETGLSAITPAGWPTWASACPLHHRHPQPRKEEAFGGSALPRSTSRNLEPNEQSMSADSCISAVSHACIA